jgi:AraC-like DNA-binding protein
VPGTAGMGTVEADRCNPPLVMDFLSPLGREPPISRLADRGWSRSIVRIAGQIPSEHENEGAVPGAQALASEPCVPFESEWKEPLSSMLSLVAKAGPKPTWWDSKMPFRASLQTWTASGLRPLAGMPSAPVVHGPATTLLITMAGWGRYRSDHGHVLTSGPGTVLFGSSQDLATSIFLPEESQEWTFARLEISHPYFHQRIAEQARALGQGFEVRADDALTASLLRLLRAEILKGLNETCDAERTLFDFVLSFEQWARQKIDGTRELERLIVDTRSCILSNLPRAIDVKSLAARFGMSRCHFSHYFRRLTGMTPGHFATEVRLQKVEELLLETRDPLKCIADACGFANPNHLCKVFRRFRHVTPTVFRQKRR